MDLERARAQLSGSERARGEAESALRLSAERIVKLDGEIVGMTRFGASAPIAGLHRELGFEPENIVAAARRTMDRITGATS